MFSPKILLIAFAAFLLIPHISAASIEVGNADIVLTSQSPYPAEPGGNVDVEIEVQNNGLSDATDVQVEIFPEPPFSLLPGQKSIKTFSRITAQSSVKTSYRLSVESGAVSSDYELKFRIYTDRTRTNYVEKKVTISVRGTPKMVIQDVTTEPEDIEPGGTARINVAIRNVGSGNARQVEAIFNSTSSDIFPVLSRGRIYLGDLEAGQTKQALFEVSVSTEAEHKTYPAAITLIYRDETNADRSESFSIGIPVTGTIIMQIISVEPDYDRNALDIEVANKGTADATAIEAKLLVDGNAAGVDYVSTLKATKKTRFSFPLVNGNARLVLEYTNPSLRKISETKELGNLSFAPKSGDNLSGIAIAAVAIIILYVLYSRLSGKRQR